MKYENDSHKDKNVINTTAVGTIQQNGSDDNRLFKLDIPEDFFILGYFTPNLQGKYGRIVGVSNEDPDNVSFELTSTTRKDGGHGVITDIPRFCMKLISSSTCTQPSIIKRKINKF